MEVHCNAKKGVKRRIAAIAKTQWLRSLEAQDKPFEDQGEQAAELES